MVKAFKSIITLVINQANILLSEITSLDAIEVNRI